MNYVSNIVSNVLGALYQTFGASVLVAVLFMFVYEYAKKHGIKESFKNWICNFKSDTSFRRTFFLALYTAMLLFRTILCRNIWYNPLENVLGVWGLHKPSGTLYTENIENIILFIPFIFLFIWAFRSKVFKDEIIKFKNVVFKSFIISFCFSASIEFSQLFFKLGTFQLSDLVFNTLGGVIGGIIYCCVYHLKERKKSNVLK